ncbi:hypothetical protein POM88_044126 [Heracleum sosnowskyi]|uniref:Uncharacterized protein n=1 Tax=Heracleum sosnowskyi TaxID=360622 RepID=A0AAD8H4U2_9APIA|nr:hypothetical protein POM88_044126 [Heracleum sosnowskyi]
MFKFRSSNNDDYASDKLDYGWNTTSQGYHDHLLRIERMPSVVPDLPRYPNIYMMLNNNNKATAQKDEEPRLIMNPSHHKNQERAKTNGGSIDAEADGFIRQEHKKFELTKWETFRAI